MLALWLAVCAVPIARAQDVAPSPSDAQPAAGDQAQLEEARNLFEQGLAHVEAGNWSDAEQAFRKVLTLRSSPVVTYNLASALARLGRLIEAAEMLRAIVRDNSVDAATRGPAQSLLAEIEPQIGSITVRVLGNTEGLVLRLDARTLAAGEIVQAISVDPGVHVVAAERDAKTLASQEVRVGGAAPLIAEVTLDVREPEPPKPVVADLRVTQLPTERPQHPPQQPSDESSMWSSPWLWSSAAAVVLVTVGVIAVVALSSGGDPELADPVSGTTDPPIIRGRVVGEMP